MAANKNHHYVPQFYFRQFSQDSKSICMLRRDTGEVIEQSSIKGQASKAWFYINAGIEKQLGIVEGRSSAAIRELMSIGNPTQLKGEHLESLFVHATTQRYRTQAARDQAQPLSNELAKQKHLVAVNANDKYTETEKSELLADMSVIKRDPAKDQVVQVIVAMHNAYLLGDLIPLILVNKTNRPFVFGDSPAIFYNARYFDVKVKNVLGITDSGLMVIMPLSSKTCWMLVDKDTYNIKSSKDNTVDLRKPTDVVALNKLQIHAASGCVYFENIKFANYVRALWLEESRRLSEHTSTIVQSPPGYSPATPDEILIHAIQHQLNYRASFSFLHYQMSKEPHDYPYLRAAYWGVSLESTYTALKRLGIA